MNVSLNGKLEQFVKSKVQSGQYSNAAEVVKVALCLLLEDERYRTPDGQDLRTAVARGVEELERNGAAKWDSEEIKALGRKLLATARGKALPRRKGA